LARLAEAAYWFFFNQGDVVTAGNIAMYYRDATGDVAWRFREAGTAL